MLSSFWNWCMCACVWVMSLFWAADFHLCGKQFAAVTTGCRSCQMAVNVATSLHLIIILRDRVRVCCLIRKNLMLKSLYFDLFLNICVFKWSPVKCELLPPLGLSKIYLPCRISLWSPCLKFHFLFRLRFHPGIYELPSLLVYIPPAITITCLLSGPLQNLLVEARLPSGALPTASALSRASHLSLF